jgi:hypothetical protein
MRSADSTPPLTSGFQPSKQGLSERCRTTRHGGTSALLELRSRPSIATILAVANEAASRQRGTACHLPPLRMALPAEVDWGELADHRRDPAGANSSCSSLTGNGTVGASESRTTRPPQAPQLVSTVGSRKRALAQSCPQPSHMRVVAFRVMGGGTALRIVLSLRFPRRQHHKQRKTQPVLARGPELGARPPRHPHRDQRWLMAGR